MSISLSLPTGEREDQTPACQDLVEIFRLISAAAAAQAHAYLHSLLPRTVSPSSWQVVVLSRPP